MNKQEYLKILSERLSVLPAEEYNNIMEYYTEYFEEAGAENESSVISELGDVEALAQRIIKENVGEENYKIDGKPIYNNQSQLYNNTQGLYNYNSQPYGYQNQPYGWNNGQPYNQPYPQLYPQPQQKGLSTGWKVAIAILTFPIWIGIAGAVFGMIFGFGVASVACFASGVATIVAGFAIMLTDVGTCLLFVGSGLVVIAVALGFALAVAGLSQLVGKVFKMLSGNKQPQVYV